MVAVEEGWYRDPTNVEHERYWLGTSWAKGARVASEDTPPFPGDEAAARSEFGGVGGGQVEGERSEANFEQVGGWMFAIAVLTGIGAVIAGIILLNHSVPNCTANSVVTCSDKHPYTGTGIAVIVGGMAQAAVIAVVGRLCRVVSELREQMSKRA